MALVENTTDHIRSISNLFTQKVHSLVPGINEIEDKVWGEVRGQLLEEIKSWLIKEHGVKVGEKLLALPDPLPPYLSKFTPQAHEVVSALTLAKTDVKAAAELVAKTYDLDLLAKWRDSETRDSIRLSIVERIAKIMEGVN